MASGLKSVAMAGPRLLAAERLEAVFDNCFASRFNTRLNGGADEPLYQPSRQHGQINTIYYRADYFASALHEVAHWCIAGAVRRTQVDFGYWYAPDGRTVIQQQAFETVEFKPQAMEWLFSRACGSAFKLSADNLDTEAGEIADISAFRQRVYRQAVTWQEHGLPQRATAFYEGLCREFGTSVATADLSLSLAELG